MKNNEIKTDCIISLGNACRPAKALARNNLRFFSSPFDWMMAYSLKDVIQILKTKGNKFFSKCSVNSIRDNYSKQIIKDDNTGMISMHDLPLNIPLEKASKFYKIKFKNRFKHLNCILKSAKNLCIITNRKISILDIQNFVKQFIELYNFQHIYFINIYDTENKNIDKFEQFEINKKLTILQYSFNDENKNGRDPSKNPEFWLGNVEYWDNILKHISLNKNFLIRDKIKRIIFNVSYDCQSPVIHKNITILGVKLKFKKFI